MPSLARRERASRELEAEVRHINEDARRSLALVPQAKAEPAVIQVTPRPRIVFMEVVRDQFGEIEGLRPVYEDQ